MTTTTTTTELLDRVAHAEVTHRGRILEGIAFGLEHVVEVSDRARGLILEEFARGCATQCLADREIYPLGVLHPWSIGQGTVPAMPIGSVRFHVAATAIEFSAKVSRVTAGDEALELILDGALGPDVSINCVALATSLRTSPRGQVVRRERVRLRELSLIPPGLGGREEAKILVHRQTAEQLATPLRNAVLDRLRQLQS